MRDKADTDCPEGMPGPPRLAEEEAGGAGGGSPRLEEEKEEAVSRSLSTRF